MIGEAHDRISAQASVTAATLTRRIAQLSAPGSLRPADPSKAACRATWPAPSGPQASRRVRAEHADARCSHRRGQVQRTGVRRHHQPGPLQQGGKFQQRRRRREPRVPARLGDNLAGDRILPLATPGNDRRQAVLDAQLTGDRGKSLDWPALRIPASAGLITANSSANSGWRRRTQSSARSANRSQRRTAAPGGSIPSGASNSR